MRTFKLIMRLGLVCGLAGPLYADDITLDGGTARLTGTVRSISGEGVVELASPISPEPVLLKSSSVRKVEFSADRNAAVKSSALVELANGDLLPVTVVGFDDRKLIVDSPDVERLEIPREALRSLQLGIQQRKLVYSGPNSLEEWSGLGDVKNWSFDHGSLIADGQAAVSKKIDLPRQFVLRFTLVWQAKSNPNFEVSFADPLKPKEEAGDRYFLRFNSAGLEVKREVSKGKRYPPSIVQLNRTPNQYPNQQLQVEIRADRQGSRLHLFLNGEPEGVFVDPSELVPVGSAISLICNGQSGNPQEIRDIEVFEFNDSRVRHRAEDRGDPKNDSLISRDDDRWGGRLTEIRKTGEENVFRFKSDFQNDPLEIPETDVSTVFFSGIEIGKPDADANPFVLRLRGDGSLRLASCRFTEDSVSAEHPLLGPLTFRRDGVLAMERIETKPKLKPAPKP